MVNVDLLGAVWRTSSRSQGDGACVQVAVQPAVAGIRDSKNPDDGVVVMPFAAWERLRFAVQQAELDLL